MAKVPRPLMSLDQVKKVPACPWAYTERQPQVSPVSREKLQSHHTSPQGNAESPEPLRLPIQDHKSFRLRAPAENCTDL